MLQIGQLIKYNNTTKLLIKFIEMIRFMLVQYAVENFLNNHCLNIWNFVKKIKRNNKKNKKV